MTWFDILKLGGEDLLGGERKENVGNENSKHDYNDTHDIRETYFYNLKDKLNVTTRPHFEWQVKNKFPEEIDGDLQAIADLIKGGGTIGNRYFGFTSEQRDHFITWNIIGKEKEYTSSGSKLRPIDLGHENKVVVFDSVYLVKERQKGDLQGAIFRPLFPNDQKIWENMDKETEGRGGNKNYFLGTDKDVTDWKVRMQKLQEKKKDIENANYPENTKTQMLTYAEKQIAEHKTKQPANVNRNTNNPNRPRRNKKRRF